MQTHLAQSQLPHSVMAASASAAAAAPPPAANPASAPSLPLAADAASALNALQVFNEIPDRPELVVAGSDVDNLQGPWTATIGAFQATHTTKLEAKRLVAEQYLNATSPGWAEARVKK